MNTKLFFICIFVSLAMTVASRAAPVCSVRFDSSGKAHVECIAPGLVGSDETREIATKSDQQSDEKTEVRIDKASVVIVNDSTANWAFNIVVNGVARRAKLDPGQISSFKIGSDATATIIAVGFKAEGLHAGKLYRLTPNGSSWQVTELH